MSRIGRMPITVPAGVTVTVGSDLELYAENPNYQPDWDYAKYITFENIKFNFTVNFFCVLKSFFACVIIKQKGETHEDKNFCNTRTQIQRKGIAAAFKRRYFA